MKPKKKSFPFPHFFSCLSPTLSQQNVLRRLPRHLRVRVPKSGVRFNLYTRPRCVASPTCVGWLWDVHLQGEEQIASTTDREENSSRCIYRQQDPVTGWRGLG